MRAVLIFKLIRHLVRQIFRVMFAQNWLLTARARLALSSVNKSPRTGPPPCSPTICRRDEVSLDEVERILIPPFPGSNPGAPASQCGLCGVISKVWENRRHSRGLAGNGHARSRAGSDARTGLYE